MPRNLKTERKKEENKHFSGSGFHTASDVNSSFRSPPPFDPSSGSGFPTPPSPGLLPDIEMEEDIRDHGIENTSMDVDTVDPTPPKKRKREEDIEELNQLPRPVKKRRVEEAQKPSGRSRKVPERRLSRRKKGSPKINYDDFSQRERKVMDEEMALNKKKKKQTHQRYKPSNRISQPKEDSNHNHITYSSFQGEDNDLYDTEFSASDSSADEMQTRRIHGKNLSFNLEKEVLARGYHNNSPYIKPNSSMQKSHLILDKAKGPGYHYKGGKNREESESHNMVTASDQYNLVLMGNMERQIETVVGKNRFDMTAYVYYHDTNRSNEIKEQLQPVLQTTTDDICQEMDQVLKGSPIRRIRELIYEIEFTPRGGARKKYRGKLGSDLALGVNETETKEKRGVRKAKKGKKEWKVDLREFPELSDNLAEVDFDTHPWGEEDDYREYTPDSKSKKVETDNIGIEMKEVKVES